MSQLTDRKTCIDVAKQAALAVRASKGVVVIAVDDNGAFGVMSYGHTREKCRELAKLCDGVAHMLRSGAMDLAESLAVVLESDDRDIFEAMVNYVREHTKAKP